MLNHSRFGFLADSAAFFWLNCKLNLQIAPLLVKKPNGALATCCLGFNYIA
jgi:hypothetical protein